MVFIGFYFLFVTCFFQDEDAVQAPNTAIVGGSPPKLWPKEKQMAELISLDDEEEW